VADICVGVLDRLVELEVGEDRVEIGVGRERTEVTKRAS